MLHLACVSVRQAGPAGPSFRSGCRWVHLWWLILSLVGVLSSLKARYMTLYELHCCNFTHAGAFPISLGRRGRKGACVHACVLVHICHGIQGFPVAFQWHSSGIASGIPVALPSGIELFNTFESNCCIMHVYI